MSTLARISIDEFERMIRHNVFDDGMNTRRLELINGEIREITPPNPPHETIVDWLNRWSFENTDPNEVLIRIQNSVGIPELDSLTMPDVAWMKAGAYHSRRPNPADVLLLIEVADTTLRDDLRDKSNLYARAGVADYWVVDINAQTIHVHRNPTDGKYGEITKATAGNSLTPLHARQAVFEVAKLFAPWTED